MEVLNDFVQYKSKENDVYLFNKNNLKIIKLNQNLKDKSRLNEKLKKHFLSNKSPDNLKFIPKYFGFRLVITEKCNFSCSHCFVKDAPNSSLMDIKECKLIEILNFICKYGKDQSVKIQFFGGEPLIRFDLIELSVEYMKKKVKEGMIKQPTYVITTNGVLINNKIAEFFKENNFGVGISLDGPKKVNDRLRVYANKKSTYDDTLKGISVLKKNNVPFWILITLLKENYREIPDYLRYFKKEFDINTITINTPINGKMQLLFDGREFAEIVFKTILVGKKLGVEVESGASAALYCLANKKKRYSKCSIGDDKIMVSVSPKGNISYCAQSWNKILSPTPVKNFRPFSFDLTFDKGCDKCDVKFICGGPCMATMSFVGKKDVEMCKFYKHLLYLFFYNIKDFLKIEGKNG